MDQRESLKKAQTVVVKVGTRTLTHATGKLNLRYMEKLVRELADLANQGRHVVLVSSGAVGAGIGKLGLEQKPQSIPEKQAVAAVGQGLLIQMYEKLFAEYGLVVAQVLLTRDDFNDRKRYLNSRNALLALLKFGVVPVINENDTVAVEEIEFGDNDSLSALVASIIGADLLVLLTDTGGLYSANPKLDDNAQRLSVVEQITPEIRQLAGETCESLATGGMVTKLMAGEMAAKSGIPMVIANGSEADVLPRILDGEDVGTLFCARDKCLESRKRWIAYGQTAHGRLIVDSGAKKALLEYGKSLLPSGILEVMGDFEQGEMVAIEDQCGNEFARGLVNYNSGELQRIKGLRTEKAAEVLQRTCSEAVHRNNMVVNS
ncbi:glutamate 5-kinase [Dethiobacter alkaliphilus]|uniref:glutamate 5-kinase n=1 Tax=Dethiobacter alkaliphilus TaxID=427926 RepID=UPI0022264DC1|nr:glutamate 5-kinase [Dethiobacter alkaliphilus]MCW3489584.1 glutamate 5-kinase [Dethiobacter alkaliphilus]